MILLKMTDSFVGIKFSGLWQKHKGKPFDEIYTDVTGKG